jgi:hypothetical protein
MVKKCSSCKKRKESKDFYHDKHSKDGFTYSCKECMLAYKKSEKGLLVEKEYKNNNKDKIRSYQENYREVNKDKRVLYDKEFYQDNKEKLLAASKVYRENHKEELKKYRKDNKDKWRKRHLKEKYGLELEDYQKMYKEQKGKCKICDNHYETLCVDHNHKTGEIRKLLCKSCNTGIGLLQDSPTITERATEYLRA